MKWMILLLTPLLIAACGFSDPDNVANREVVVATPNDKQQFADNYPTVNVTDNMTEYY